MNRKKLAETSLAVISAVTVLFGGTFAWQSINQRALNEASGIVNPGGRLHDDFNGENKDVYVENFADEPIFARIRLSEYLSLINNKGILGVEKENSIVGDRDENGVYTYEVHLFGSENKTDSYWQWTMGGKTVYMPTFNKNKDSLAGDVNGTYLGPDGIVTDLADDDRYADYVEYSVNDEKTAYEIYDGDENSLDEVGTDFSNLDKYIGMGNIVVKENITHTAKETLEADFLSIDEWLKKVEDDGGYNEEMHGKSWVYDDDGWVYWSSAIMPQTATGLLLNEIKLKSTMDDSWYYAIDVTAQFVTADDIGKNDGSGFYDIENGSKPTEKAETLLEMITWGK